jgi:hypothetical protein
MPRSLVINFLLRRNICWKASGYESALNIFSNYLRIILKWIVDDISFVNVDLFCVVSVACIFEDGIEPFGSHVLINKLTALCGLNIEPVTDPILRCGMHEILSKIHKHLIESALTLPVLTAAGSPHRVGGADRCWKLLLRNWPCEGLHVALLVTHEDGTPNTAIHWREKYNYLFSHQQPQILLLKYDAVCSGVHGVTSQNTIL